MIQIPRKTLEQWCEEFPLVKDLVELNETSWFNSEAKIFIKDLNDAVSAALVSSEQEQFSLS